MERWGWRVMADKKKKPKLTLVISVGPKMKTKPTDASTPDMKKYGSMPMKKAWSILKNEEPDYEIPEFGDEEERQFQSEQEKRAAMMAEGVPEMRMPRSAPRPGDPRFADPNKPRPSIPRDVFGKAWDMLKGERGGLPSNFKRTKTSAMPEPEPMPKPEAEPETPTPQKVAAAKQQFDFINDIRRKRGEPPISIDEHLQQAGLKLEDYDREYHPEALE
jgi:hypothetical protein